MLAPEIEEVVTCNLEIRETFKISKVGTIAGCMVLDGKVTRNTKVRVIRDGIVIYTGVLGSLKRYMHVVDFGSAVWLQFVVITVLLTFLLLLFGEIMPKVYCGQHALKMCRLFCDSIFFLRKLFRPLANILLRSERLSGCAAKPC